MESVYSRRADSRSVYWSKTGGDNRSSRCLRFCHGNLFCFQLSHIDTDFAWSMPARLCYEHVAVTVDKRLNDACSVCDRNAAPKCHAVDGLNYADMLRHRCLWGAGALQS